MTDMDSVQSGKRVVSFFIWDPELERKINREVKMIDGIGKMLNVSTTVEQTIECHKALILSQQRMLAFMAEIQRKQKNLLKKDNLDVEPTKATVILSDIRIPIVWNKIKSKSDQKKFAVFCLARVGCDILDTQTKFIDKQSSEIIFTDKITFENVPYDFQLHLEIYALNKTLAISSSVKEFANRYSYFSVHGSPNLSRKSASNSSSNQTKSSDAQQQSKFCLIGRTIFTRESVHKMAIGRNLMLQRTQDNPLMQLPIQSTFVSRFLIQPLCYTRLVTFTGIVEIERTQYVCTITAGFLNGEQIMHNDYSDQHRFSIPITPSTIILSNLDRLSFSVFNRGFDQEEFFVRDHFTLNNWIEALQQHIIDIRAWQKSLEHLPSMRRYSQQALISPIYSSIAAKIHRRKSSLKTKAQSLDNLHQLKISSDLLAMNPTTEITNLDNISLQMNAEDDGVDNADQLSTYHTRF